MGTCEWMTLIACCCGLINRFSSVNLRTNQIYVTRTHLRFRRFHQSKTKRMITSTMPPQVVPAMSEVCCDEVCCEVWDVLVESAEVVVGVVEGEGETVTLSSDLNHP